MIKKTLMIFISLLFLSTAYSAPDSQKSIFDKYDKKNFIYVGSPSIKKIRVAIPNFYIEQPSKKSSSVLAVTNRFKELLEFTHWFYVLPQDVYPNENADNSSKLDEWKVLQTEYVVFGKLTQKKSQNSYDFDLWAEDISKNKIVAKKSYSNVILPYSTLRSSKADTVQKDLNLILRDFGDVFVKEVTGKASPFMTQIAFVGRASQHARISNIYISDFDGRNAYSITKPTTINLSPSWSHDGKKILYTSFRTKKAEIFEYNVKTKKTIQVTFENANSSGAVWNTSGNLIAFSSSTKKGFTHLFTTTGPGVRKKPLITSSRIAVEPAFSPDGTSIAYTSNRYAKPMIFVLNLKTHKTTRLTYAGWYNASASWKPNNKQLAFSSFDRQINRWDLFRINANGTELTRLTLQLGDNEKPTWSPDGRFIMFQSNRGEGSKEDTVKGNKYKLYVMDPDGDHQDLLNTNIPDSRQPAWGPRLSAL